MPCPICRSDSATLLQVEPASDDPTRSAEYTKRSVNLVRCNACSFMYVDRDFPEEYVDLFYQERAGGGYDLNDTFYWWHEATKASNHQILSLLGKPNSRRLLEIGCGCGAFLKDALDSGWDVEGMEINSEFSAFCKKTMGVEVRCGTVASPPFPPESFDVVAMLDVLEHMYDPVHALKQASNLLKRGGMVVIKSPNGPMQLRKERLKKRLGKGTGYVAHIGHLNQFSPRTLKLTFRESGLEPIDVRPAYSFQQGITGPGFTFQRVIRHGLILAANGAMQISGLGLNMIGLARKAAA
jgi:2-polyprenyl-3-methyl-5-hydroxy-6-metoxy-1,4-benzoquinol methylase